MAKNGLYIMVPMFFDGGVISQDETRKPFNKPTLAKSLTVSVFPVPAGPAGDPPRCRCRAPVKVR